MLILQWISKIDFSSETGLMKNGSDYRIGFKIAVGLAHFNQKTFQTLTLFADFFIFQKTYFFQFLFILPLLNTQINW